MDIELQHKYDEVCGAAYVNIFHLSKDSDVIAISPFNHKDKEHMFVLNIAKAVGGVNGKTVAVDTSRFRLWRLNRGLDKECKFQRLVDADPFDVINPDELLNFMRESAVAYVGDEGFNFGKIYDSFYKKG